jgi:hypothetical protein
MGVWDNDERPAMWWPFFNEINPAYSPLMAELYQINWRLFSYAVH